MTGERRILQVVGSLDLGGAETMIVSATHELARMGFQVDFLVFGEHVGVLESEVERLGCRVLRTDAPDVAGHIRSIQVLADLFGREGPFDVVHSHVNFASGLVVAAAARAGVPMRIVHSHGTRDYGEGLWRAPYKRLMRYLINSRATTMVGCGDDAGRYLFGRSWDEAGVVVPNGIDVDRFVAARDARIRFREELAIGSEVVLTAAIGRIAPEKNQTFLVDVMRLDNEKRIHLLIVGDGPLREELTDHVRAAGLEDRITFLGLRRDVARILAALDYLLLPSLHEGLPVILVEAQAVGTHVLVSSTVTNEVDLGLGLLTFLPTDDPQAWCGALLGPAPDEVAELDIRRRFDETGYNSADSAGRLAALYESR